MLEVKNIPFQENKSKTSIEVCKDWDLLYMKFIEIFISQQYYKFTSNNLN